MAKVKDIIANLSQLDGEQDLFAVMLTRGEFDGEIIQGHTNPIQDDETFARFVKEFGDGDFGMGQAFIDSHGEVLSELWEMFLDEQEEED